MKNFKEKLVASASVAILVCSNVCLPSICAEININPVNEEVVAMENANNVAEISGKEENVYANLNNDGTIKNVYVVNKIDLLKAGKITDYGNYGDVRNLSNSGKININTDIVELNGTDGKNYYQGTMTNNEMPWNISVKYFLEGKEISANEIAGKSGNIEIKINITKNPNVNPTFFEHFLLQATLSLNSENCTNIETEGATIANVGENKQLTYMIFAGEEKEISLKFHSDSFELEDGISFNGVLMNLVIDSLDTTEITNKVNELSGAISDLNSGASELKSGSNTFSSSLNTLATNASAMSNGSSQIQNGINSALTGVTTIKANVASKTNATNSLEGMDNLILEQIDAVLQTEPYASLISANPQMLPVLQNLLAQTVTQTITTVSNEYNTQISSTLTELTAGLTNLENGLSTLSSSYGQLNSGINTVISSINSLNGAYSSINNGVNKISSGATEMNNETQNLGSDVDNKINEMINKFNNKDYQVVSFVSDKNTNVKAVQFVIKTEGIKVKEEKKEENKKEKDMSFGEKFINLFK